MSINILKIHNKYLFTYIFTFFIYLCYINRMNKNIFKKAVRKFGTQTALAIYLGIDKQYLSAIKHERQNPKRLIAKITDVANDKSIGLNDVSIASRFMRRASDF